MYVTSFPQPGQRFPVSDTNANFATWAPDGRTIYYVSEGTMVAASVETSPRFAVTGRRDLFRSTSLPRYDVDPEGGRFVMVLPADTVPVSSTIRPPRLVMVVNWIEEFRRRAEASR